MTCAIHMVVAVAENGVIGHQGNMPWRLPSDLKHFKAVTMGHAIIMGRKTWASIGRPLPGRQNIVISRNADGNADGATWVTNPEAALAAVQGDCAMIIGGGEIYRLFEEQAEVVHLTRVHDTPAGDTFFALSNPNDWVEVSHEAHKAGAGDSADFTFIDLQKRLR
jgi:dihydrofolate reductase